MRLFFSLPLLFLLYQMGNKKAEVAQNNKCSKGFLYFSKIENSYQKGISMYPAKKVRITADTLGMPIYRIKKRNKEISYLNDFTKIVCPENSSGTYILTIEILQKWKNWFAENCNKSRSTTGQ